MLVCLIAATSLNGVLGRAGTIPWRARKEQTRFKQATMGKIVIMGRKTYESLPGSLPGRELLILTRQARLDRVAVAKSFDAALDLAASKGAKEVFIGGGAAVYEQALPLADIIYHSVIEVEVEGDVRMPKIGPAFQEIWRRRVVDQPSFTMRTLVIPSLLKARVDDHFGLVRF